MTSHWIQHEHNPNLIVVFNGWGMDQHPLRSLHCDPQDDVLLFYDYRDLTLDDEVLHQCQHYTDVSVIAWSMGVWAYARLSSHLSGRVSRAIAVNGTCLPIHEQYGISPHLYQATLSHFSAQSREKFFKRMCTSREIFNRFHESQPQRILAGQQEELLAIQQQAISPFPLEAFCYTHAIIGRKDRIIPVRNQQHFWEQHAPYTLIDAPHFPFFRWKRWRAILDYATEYS